MNLKESVSVVIPAYNAELFIEDAVKSCLNQTYRPIEIIVVNDGSTDSTADKVNCLSNLVQGDELELRIINIGENKGTGNALHVGFSEAKGDHICWLSADDMFIDREKIKKQVLYINRSKAYWSYFRNCYKGTNLSSAIFARPSYLPRLQILDSLFVYNSELRLMMLLFRNPINGSSVMIRRDCIEAYGQFDPIRNVDSDGDLWMRYSALKLKLAAIKGAPVFYRRHPKQVSAKRKVIIYGSELTRMRMLLTLEKKGNLVKLIKKFAPYLTVILMNRAHFYRPFVSEFMFNYILEHKNEFNKIFLTYIYKSLEDVKKHTNYLMLDKDKFLKDLAFFMESHTFKKFEEVFLK